MADDIVPFVVQVDNAVLDDLRSRLARTRWPEREPVDDWSQGVPLGYLRAPVPPLGRRLRLARREERLNGFPQYRTEIDGLGVHFIHVPLARSRARSRSCSPTAGRGRSWSSSTSSARSPTRAAHGGDAADAFHVVCPSLPGYGFSDKPAEPGWGVERIARAWAQLMARLGYDRYGAQGGDWGSAVTAALGTQDAEHVAGIHLNMVDRIPGGRGPGRSDRRREVRARVRWSTTGAGTRVLDAAVDPAPDARLRAGRLAGRAVRVDPREVLVLDRHRAATRSACSGRTGSSTT